MSYSIDDRSLIDELCNKIHETVVDKVSTLTSDLSKQGYTIPDEFVHPLDEDIIGTSGALKSLLAEDEHFFSYAKAEKMDKLWSILLDKAIRCLRYFDSREPFLARPGKAIIAYGIDSLEEYHKKYTEFEGLMYGANSYYRDHIFHAIRVWMLGVFCLLNRPTNGEPFIESIGLDGGAKPPRKINFFEYISMWTVAALCHDLGYPLEKAEQILDKTRRMMREFVPNPSVMNNYGFTGTQDSINEYILKFISTKMKQTTVPNNEESAESNEQSKDNPEDIPKEFVFSKTRLEKYNGRIQPKYYLKYAKSLENSQHGIISTIIIYKMLLYFLESDFNLNDDYVYSAEDAQQFYIRREILRAMAAHTCPDAYNVHITTFPSLLFMCDEMQEWGRKTWNELYTGLRENSVELEIEKFNQDEISISETIDMAHIIDDGIIVQNICQVFLRQYSLYKKTFRDGQYTSERDFELIKTMKFKLRKDGTKTREILIEYRLPKVEKSCFQVNLSGAGSEEEIKRFQKDIDEHFRKQPYYSDVKIVTNNGK